MSEQELRATLFELVRELYPPKQAQGIIESFEASFAALEDEERLNVVQHWLDFYRLQKYRRAKQRRRPTFRERISSCSACGYPTSHRHHLWDIAMHGENDVTIQLCANCHELHHLMYNALVKDAEYSRKLVIHVLFSGKLAFEVTEKILGWCLATIRYEAKNGWIEEGRDAPAWIEARFHWAEYAKANQMNKGEQAWS